MSPDTVFTAAQVSELLALEHLKKNECPHKPASSGTQVTNQPNHSTRRGECT